MKIVVAGTRTFNDYELLKYTLDKFIKESDADTITIVSGHAEGADKLGEKYAVENDYELELYPAEWEKYGPSAGPIRNRKMAYAADKVICFWDGKSAGTASMIDAAEDYFVPCTTIIYSDKKKDVITSLKSNEVFVFGSNEAGRHGKGAAYLAHKQFGAECGKGYGQQGQSFAIPTKDKNLNTLPLKKIQNYLEKFVAEAATKPELIYLLTPIGTGLAGYSIDEIESILPELPENVRKVGW